MQSLHCVWEKDRIMSKTVAIVLAAGQGKRMNSKVHKQYLLLRNKPILYYSLKAFEDSFIDEIVLVVGKGEIAYCQQEIVDAFEIQKVTHIVEGGRERYHSVFEGLKCIRNADYVFIHDGARPFVNQEMLKRVYDSVVAHNACVVGMPVKDTIKIADTNGFVKDTPERKLVWMVQTPQVFSYQLIMQAYTKLIDQEQALLEEGIIVTDDAMVVEHFEQIPVKLVEGSYQNIKITTPEDLVVAESFLK